METLQIRLTKNLIDKLEGLVKRGSYSSRSEVIRDAIRRFLQEESFVESVTKKPKARESKSELLERHYIG
mgnify:FL=1